MVSQPPAGYSGFAHMAVVVGVPRARVEAHKVPLASHLKFTQYCFNCKASVRASPESRTGERDSISWQKELQLFVAISAIHYNSWEVTFCNSEGNKWEEPNQINDSEDGWETDLGQVTRLGDWMGPLALTWAVKRLVTSFGGRVWREGLMVNLPRLYH